ncbi:hypothetical protein FRC09_008648 [Ceratobasidium sp. 395]|nr:hypothetical protein FRC09_008648 [Ceratobasidium sp. 395]
MASTKTRPTTSSRLRQLQKTAARLNQEAEKCADHALGIDILPDWTTDKADFLFHSERYNPDDPEHKHLKPKKGRQHCYQRAMNSWALRKVGTKQLVVPELPGDEAMEYELVGFVSPLSDGARRVSRVLAGLTPLYAGQSHPDLWQMPNTLMKARVRGPHMGVIEFYGCQIPCVLFPSALVANVEYAVQNPDTTYEPFQSAMLARWNVYFAEGRAQKLQPWKDIDLAAPRPWWCNEWAMMVMRLEQNIPPNPADPKRRAALGHCRTERRIVNRRAPNNEREWLAIDEELYAPGDDEADDDDAGSIVDDTESGVPTSSHWDPATKKSTTPQGSEPHPHMDVVRSLLLRNLQREQQERNTRSAAAGSSQTPPSASSSRSDTRIVRVPSPSGTVRLRQPALPGLSNTRRDRAERSHRGVGAARETRSGSSNTTATLAWSESNMSVDLPPPTGTSVAENEMNIDESNGLDHDPDANAEGEVDPDFDNPAPSPVASSARSELGEPPQPAGSAAPASLAEVIESELNLDDLGTLVAGATSTAASASALESARPAGFQTPTAETPGSSLFTSRALSSARPQLFSIPKPGTITKRTGLRSRPHSGQGREQSRDFSDDSQ